MYKHITMLMIGVLFIILGMMNIKGNISTIHWYNRIRITEETRPKYGKLMGAGTIIIGSGFILDTLLNLLFVSTFSELIGAIIVGVTCIVGLAVMLYAQIKYNKGIF